MTQIVTQKWYSRSRTGAVRIRCEWHAFCKFITRGNGSIVHPCRKEVEVPRGVVEGSKLDRLYEHIQDSYEELGLSESEAEEHAAQTVNNERQEASETKKSRGGKER